jgi:hypothetical protein
MQGLNRARVSTYRNGEMWCDSRFAAPCGCPSRVGRGTAGRCCGRRRVLVRPGGTQVLAPPCYRLIRPSQPMLLVTSNDTRRHSDGSRELLSCVMARVIQDVCDGCGEVRGTTNHWWTIREGDTTSLTVEPFRPENTPLDSCMQIFCGEVCATKRVSEWMSGKGQTLAQRTPFTTQGTERTPRPEARPSSTIMGLANRAESLGLDRPGR